MILGLVDKCGLAATLLWCDPEVSRRRRGGTAASWLPEWTARLNKRDDSAFRRALWGRGLEASVCVCVCVQHI